MTPRRGLDLEIIVATAAGMADEHGIEAVTLASLSQQLGIRPPSLYNHVNGLNGLRRHLAVAGLKQLTEAIETAINKVNASLGGNGGEDETMREIARAYIAFARRHPGLYELTLRSPQERDDEFESESNKVIGMLLEALAPYRLEENVAIHMIRGFRSYLHGFATLEQRGGFGMPLDVDESIELTIQAFLIGLKGLGEGRLSQ